MHRKRRWAGKAVLIPPLSPLLVSGFTILFFLCLLILLISGTYTRRVAVRSELVSVPRAITLFSEARGVIVSQRVCRRLPSYQRPSAHLLPHLTTIFYVG
ncbi:hypothetical protein LU631_17380 [Erwinia tracheiphila]|uniref:hypothetical protein n=1 Tax=Erwinia tracheiphila TaxID=65700 RepID=UPI000A524BB2|nr:hypothetical protein [Erwinia tracheiphila]UIA86664.1 hypothetical protein LU631_17380 [Erwinia tracheiphila]UIA95019.1 hypothetical protein LU633_15840 [Erwinia tracheiphila]